MNLMILNIMGQPAYYQFIDCDWYLPKVHIYSKPFSLPFENYVETQLHKEDLSSHSKTMQTYMILRYACRKKCAIVTITLSFFNNGSFRFIFFSFYLPIHAYIYLLPLVRQVPLFGFGAMHILFGSALHCNLRQKLSPSQYCD